MNSFRGLLILLPLLLGGVAPAARDQAPQESLDAEIERILTYFGQQDLDVRDRIDEIIARHPEHPRIFDLRLHRISRVWDRPPGERTYREQIESYRRLAEEALASSDRTLAFECEIRIGQKLHMFLKDYEAAFRHYVTLVHHPVFTQAHSLEDDYRRLRLYTSIVESAGLYVTPTLRSRAPAAALDALDAIEKYANLVMSYPWQGMRDRTVQAKVYELVQKASRTYVIEFGRDLNRLLKSYAGTRIPASEREDLYRRIAAREGLTQEQLTVMRSEAAAGWRPKLGIPMDAPFEDVPPGEIRIYSKTSPPPPDSPDVVAADSEAAAATGESGNRVVAYLLSGLSVAAAALVGLWKAVRH